MLEEPFCLVDTLFVSYDIVCEEKGFEWKGPGGGGAIFACGGDTVDSEVLFKEVL